MSECTDTADGGDGKKVNGTSPSLTAQVTGIPAAGGRGCSLGLTPSAHAGHETLFMPARASTTLTSVPHIFNGVGERVEGRGWTWMQSDQEFVDSWYHL